MTHDEKLVMLGELAGRILGLERAAKIARSTGSGPGELIGDMIDQELVKVEKEIVEHVKIKVLK